MLDFCTVSFAGMTNAGFLHSLFSRAKPLRMAGLMYRMYSMPVLHRNMDVTCQDNAGAIVDEQKSLKSRFRSFFELYKSLYRANYPDKHRSDCCSPCIRCAVSSNPDKVKV